MKKIPPSFLILLALSFCLIAGVRPLSLNKTRAELAPGQPLRQSAEIEDTVERARALLALSESQNTTDHALALKTAYQALALWETTTDNSGIARAYAHVARCHTAQSDLVEATQNYEKALQKWRELNDRREQAGVLILLGYIEARKGEWQNSISYFTQAQELTAQENDPQRMGQITSGLGYVFNESGLPDRGLTQYQQALEFYCQTPDTRDDALTILEIGITYYLLGDYPEALRHIEQALTGVTPGSTDAAQCHHFTGKVYNSMGVYDQALLHLQSTLPIYTSAGNLKEAAEARMLIGQIYEQQGRLEQARQHYRQALATFTRLSDRINQAAIYFSLGRLELRGKRYDLAEDYLQHSVRFTEDIRRTPTSSDLTAAFSAIVYERYEKYVECIMRRHESQPGRGLNVRAFELSERGRARSLTELLRATGTGIVQGREPELARQEKSLRQTLRAKADSKVALLGGRYKAEELTALNAELARLEAEYKRVNEAILERHSAYEQIARPVVWDLRRIQEEVVADDQTVLLEFLIGADKSYAWAVTHDSIRSYELPERARINGAAEKAYKLLSKPPGEVKAEELAAALGELSRMVLSPLTPEFKNKSRIIVVADGVLNYIPFQVLPITATGDAPGVSGYEFVNVPSASLLGELRREAAQRQPAAKLLAAFGNPKFAPDYARRVDANAAGGDVAALLPPDDELRRRALRDIELNGDSFDPSVLRPLFYAGRELSHILGATAGGETFVAAGYEATRERLLNTDLSQFAILHFATHGLLNPKRPESSGLVLSTVDSDGRTLDGFVGLQNIYELRTPVNLVVLSACQTGLGKDMRGEGLLSLTRGFMYAGASSVVASLWKVNDEATAELMKEFYVNMLQKGMTPAAALRAAQNTIRQKPEWRSPYYWAAFTLQGEYGQVIKPVPAAGRAEMSYLTMTAGGLLLTCCAGIGWLCRRRRQTS